MLLALIIGAAAVVAFICSFAMFLQYMREDADDDDNSKRPAGVNRVRDPTSRAGASAGGTNDDRWIYVDTRYRVGDPGHLKGFADEEAANRWFEENDPEGVAFEYEVLE